MSILYTNYLCVRAFNVSIKQGIGRGGVSGSSTNGNSLLHYN